MKSFIFIFTATFMFSAFAQKNLYKIKYTILVDGKSVSNSMIHVKEGVKGTVKKVVRQNEDKLETEVSVIAQEGQVKGHKGIIIDMEVHNIENEVMRAISKPKILVKEGEEATLRTSTVSGSNTVELRIKAQRIKS